MRGVDTSLALKEQVDLFTPRAVGDLVSGDFLAFNSEGLSGRQQVIQSPAIRRQAMRNQAYSANGTMEASGAIEFTATNTVLDKLLGLVFHQKTGTADAANGQGATYTLVDGGAVTPFTTFIGFNGPEGTYTRRFSGCKVNSASFSARVDSMLTINLDIAGVNKEILAGAPTAVYPGSGVEYGYVFYEASVLLQAGDMSNLVELPVDAFDIEINHNLAVDRYRLGSVFRRSLEEGVTDVTGSFTLDAASRALVTTPAVPAVAAAGSITIADNGQINATDTITVGGSTLTFVGAAPGADEVEIGANAGETRDNLLAALQGLSTPGFTAASSGADGINLTATVAGVAGNGTALTVSGSGITVVAFAGGADLVPAVGGTLALDGSSNHDPAFFERVAREARYASLVFRVVKPSVTVGSGGDATDGLLEITLPAVRLEEPDFNVRDAGPLTGTARFTAYDSISLKHVATLS